MPLAQQQEDDLFILYEHGYEPQWSPAREDPLWQALSKVRDTHLAQYNHRVAVWAEQAQNGKEIDPTDYRIGQRLGLQAAAVEAMRILYEVEAIDAQKQDKTEEAQRMAGRKALKAMSDKLAEWINSGGKGKVPFNDREAMALDTAAAKICTHYRRGRGGSVPVRDHGIFTGRRNFLRVAGAVFGLSAPTAITTTNLAFSAASKPVTPTPEMREQLAQLADQEGALLRDKTKWTPEYEQASTQALNALALQRNALYEDPHALKKVGLSVAAAGATLAALGSFATWLVVTKRHPGDEKERESIESDLEKISGFLGDIMGQTVDRTPVNPRTK